MIHHDSFDPNNMFFFYPSTIPLWQRCMKKQHNRWWCPENPVEDPKGSSHNWNDDFLRLGENRAEKITVFVVEYFFESMLKIHHLPRTRA